MVSGPGPIARSSRASFTYEALFGERNYSRGLMMGIMKRMSTGKLPMISREAGNRATSRQTGIQHMVRINRRDTEYVAGLITHPLRCPARGKISNRPRSAVQSTALVPIVRAGVPPYLRCEVRRLRCEPIMQRATTRAHDALAIFQRQSGFIAGRKAMNNEQMPLKAPFSNREVLTVAHGTHST